MNLLEEKERLAKQLDVLVKGLESTQIEISVTRSKLRKLDKVIKAANEIVK